MNNKQLKINAMEPHVKSSSNIKIEDVVTKKITPFLWFNTNAVEAVNLYTSKFSNSSIDIITHYSEEGAAASGMEKGSVMTIAFKLFGQEFVAINGGPAFTFSPSISFFVNCDSKEELNILWNILSVGGEVLMDVGEYPFSKRYGWLKDKFGVSWQMILDGRKQKIAPCLMFSGNNRGKAENAINFYSSVFKDSGIIQLERYEANEGPEGTVKHARFVLNGYEMIAMDSHIPNGFTFNPSISFVVNCETQDEIDYYWFKLTEGGDEAAQQCGWLQDKYGVSWQVVPSVLSEMLNSSDKDKSRRVTQAFTQMKKINMNVLWCLNDY